MQIAICHENVSPRRGGAEMYVADLARGLAAAGHELHLYASRWDATALPASMIVHALPRVHGPRAGRPWLFSAAVRAALGRDRPQVSLGFDKVLGTDVYYPLGGLHVATADHNLLKHSPGLFRACARFAQYFETAHWSYSRLERRLLTGVDHPLLVVNSALVRQHAQHYYGVDPATVPVIHNAIDPNRFDETDRPAVRAMARKQWDIEPDAVVAAVVAMNYRLKGLEPLFRALRHVPKDVPFKLLVAGNPHTGPWRRMAKRLGVIDRLRMIGHCNDVRRVFFAADFFVHPTFYDPCSLVVLEALACGLPIITTKMNGAGELMHPPAEGFVIDDPHDRLELADRITELLDPSVRAACSSAARLAASRWTFTHHVRAFESVLAQVAERRNHAAA